ncbi:MULTISPECIES: hypothetical protein [unclassified Francisella]|uniref:hypothetical protein n=1 Tax=unclassified Francisella TaxID=2610885 RepID=UPI002E34CA06|nr:MULTISPECIES: hypothetical protein [unclassified Francisella]MED7818911.1 hypothetical protein [Francisella sp. 19S2-4]MED7829748.1 hypothetical protein [Francisella sp. 19S2-10]
MRKKILNPSFIYCVSTALSAIYINQLVTKLDPLVVLLICVVTSTFFFHLINFGKLGTIYASFLKTYQASIAINISAGILWISTFIGLSIIDPYIYMVIYFIVPSVIALVGEYSTNRNKMSLISGVSLFAILIISIYLYIGAFTSRSVIYGISIALVGGISSYIYRIQAKSYSLKTQFSTSMVLCVRSYGIILICTFIIIFYPKNYSEFMSIFFNAHTVTFLLVVIVLSFIVPLYFNQKGIEKSGAKIHSIICASIPLLTLILSEFGHNQYIKEETLKNYILAALITIFLTLPTFIKNNRTL